MCIRDPGWKKVGSGINNKHPGSAWLFLERQIQENKGWRSTHLADGVVFVVQHVAEGGQQLRPLRHLACNSYLVNIRTITYLVSSNCPPVNRWREKKSVFRIRIGVLGLPDPHQDPLVTSTESDPAPKPHPSLFS
jgi:hypothetical protein